MRLQPLLVTATLFLSGCTGYINANAGGGRLPLVSGEVRVGAPLGTVIQVFNMDTTAMICGAVSWKIVESIPVPPGERCVLTVAVPARHYGGRVISLTLRFIDTEGRLLGLLSEDTRVTIYGSRGVTCTASRAQGIKCDSRL